MRERVNRHDILGNAVTKETNLRTGTAPHPLLHPHLLSPSFHPGLGYVYFGWTKGGGRVLYQSELYECVLHPR